MPAAFPLGPGSPLYDFSSTFIRPLLPLPRLSHHRVPIFSSQAAAVVVIVVVIVVVVVVVKKSAASSARNFDFY